jgi:hypothetical protein
MNCETFNIKSCYYCNARDISILVNGKEIGKIRSILLTTKYDCISNYFYKTISRAEGNRFSRLLGSQNTAKTYINYLMKTCPDDIYWLEQIIKLKFPHYIEFYDKIIGII